jgi:hypothetical protein
MNATNLYGFAVSISCLTFPAAGQTWTQLGALKYNGAALAMSADGCKLSATTSTAHPAFSTDAGQTWQTNQSQGKGYIDIASSADGTKLVAPFLGGNLYVSTNSGSTWAITTAPKTDYRAVCSSALGNILAAAGLNGSDTSGYLYVSTNSGLTWATNTSLNRGWMSIAGSADGSKLAAGAYADKIYVSTNFGTTWTATQSPTGSWFSIACSADGTKLIASGNATFISTNAGGQWALASPNAGYVAASADGSKFIFAGSFYSLPRNPNHSIYTSSDSGVTWVSNNAPASGWTSVASSADGAEFVAATGGSGIWIGRTTPAPQLNVERAVRQLTLSWLVPSTSFDLQQNSGITKAKWVTLTNMPAFDPASLQNQIALPYSDTSQEFFRLIAQ